MADGHGGYRKPAQPAPVSGPGALSQRTDGKPGQPVTPVSGLGYGENQAVNQLQGAAPMASAGDNQAAPPMITPLDAPTNRPDQPVTAGVAAGPGPGPEVMGTPFRRVTDMLASMLGNDISGDLEELYFEAERLNM